MNREADGKATIKSGLYHMIANVIFSFFYYNILYNLFVISNTNKEYLWF